MKRKVFSLITVAAILVNFISATAITSSADIVSSADTTSIVATDYKVSTSANAEEMWDFLLAKIGNPYGVAAILGNLYAESGLRSNNLENGYEKKIGYTDSTYTAAVDNGSYTNFVKDACGYGLAQWTYWSRKQNLLNYARNTGRSIGDMQMQLEFLINELSSGYKSVYNTVKNATSVKQASDAILTGYERPANMGDSVKNYRASLSQGYYDKFADNPPAPTPGTDSSTTGNPIYKVSSSIGSNVRSGPSTSYGVVGASPCGSTFTVTKTSGDWGYTDSIATTAGVKSGWVHLGYCELIGYNGEHQHSFTKTLIQNATCIQVGKYKYTCSCGDSYTENTSTIAHNYSSAFTIDTKATCVENGSKSRHCVVCNAKTDVTTIPATGHNGEYVKLFPSCTEGGYEKFICHDCGMTETKTLDASGHRDYHVTTIAPTYFAQGYTEKTCGHCNYSYRENYTAKKILSSVSGFCASSKSYNSVNLIWSKNSSASGYVIQQMKNGVWTNIANIKNSATTSYKISGLNASTKYQFRAVAYITSGGKTAYSKYTSAVSVATSSVPKPAKMTGLKVTANGSKSVTLSWNKVNADGYILQCLKNGNWVNVANIKDSAIVSHKVTGLYENSTYKFRVVAYNKIGTSTVYGTYSSAVASRTSPAAVKNLKMTNRGTDFISVRWDKNADADGYIVYIYDGTKWTCVKTLTSASSVSHKITGLASGNAYKVTVKAYKTANGTKYISDTVTISANTM